MAAVWAIQKCRHLLYCRPGFDLITDHQPLVGTFKKELGEIPNRCLQRFRERVLDYSFTTQWVEGKGHLITDALSRAPVQPADAEADAEKLSAVSVIQSLDPQLDELRQAAGESEEYRRLVEAVSTLTAKQARRLSSAHPAAPYKPVWDELSVHTDGQLLLYQADRLVVPEKERARILALLHLGHSGIVKTRALARQLYYWPGMALHVKQMVEACDACAELLPRQRAQPLTQMLAHFPMHHTSADLFQLAGHHYLAFADRFSGMLWCERLTRLSLIHI